MSQKQKTPKKSSALDALGSITDDALSQTVDTDLEIGSSKKKTPKNALRRRIQASQDKEQSSPKEGAATPVRKTSSQEQESDEDIAATPKRKGTPAPKKKSKKSDGVQKKRGRTAGSSIKTKSKIKTAEGEFTESEIKAFDLMRRSDFILPRASFLRLLKEVIRSMQPDFRIARDAVDLIQTVVEDKMTDVFFVGNALALSRQQSTVKAGDVRMAALIRGVSGSGLHMHTTYDLKKVLQGYGWKREELTQGNVGPDLIAQQGMLKLEMLSNKKKGIESKPKKTTDDNDEDYVRKTNKRKKATSDDEAGESDKSDSDDEKPKKKAKKSAKKAEKKKQTEEDASDSEQEY